MATERTYTIPLRKEFSKSPRYKRTNKAVEAVRSFLERHMKSDDIVIGEHLNKELWKHGIRNPPSRVKVNVIKDDEGKVRVELFGVEIKKEEPKKKGIGERLKKAVTKKPEEKSEGGIGTVGSDKEEEKVEEKKPEPKKEEKHKKTTKKKKTKKKTSKK